MRSLQIGNFCYVPRMNNYSAHLSAKIDSILAVTNFVFVQYISKKFQIDFCIHE